MNAAEIIEQIKQLPPNEKGKVVDYLRADESLNASDQMVKETAEAVFQTHADLFRKLAQ